MVTLLENTVEQTAFNLLKLAVTELPWDIKQALEQAVEQETSRIARDQLKIMISNVKLAERNTIPLCQDTGIINFYLMMGEEFPLKHCLTSILKRATIHATERIPLRPNAVNPFTARNSGDNTGRCLPYIEWELVEGNTLQLTVVPKGGGSENMCTLGMLNPGLGVKGIKRFIVEMVVKAGGKPCPPVVLGIGIGGGGDVALKLAKKALLRPLSQSQREQAVTQLEDDLLKTLNQTGIGPMGLGGDTTVLGVNVEYAHRHPASLPVGLAFQCWAARRASAKIWPDGRVDYMSHRYKEGS